MGDNRAESMDCRKFGCIPIEKIESKVLYVTSPSATYYSKEGHNKLYQNGG